MESIKRSFIRFRRTPAFTGCMLFLAVLVLDLIIQGPGQFFSTKSLNTLFSKNMPLMLVAMAQSLLLISGTLDISVGIQLALVNVVSIMTMQVWHVPMIVGFLMGMLASFAASSLCGFAISVLRLPAMLASYALLIIIKGVNVLIMSKPQGNVPQQYYGTYDSLIGGVIPFSALFLLAVILLWVYIKRTKFGRNIYAVGGNPRNAFAAGIDPVRVQMQAFLVKGFIIGLAGICLTLMTASGNPLQAEDYGIRSLSACIIGGLGFGGWGTMGCAVFGGGFLVLIQNTVYYTFTLLNKLMPALKITSYWQNLVSDCIIFLGLLMTIVTAKAQRETLKQGFVKQFKRGERIDK